MYNGVPWGEMEIMRNDGVMEIVEEERGRNHKENWKILPGPHLNGCEDKSVQTHRASKPLGELKTMKKGPKVAKLDKTAFSDENILRLHVAMHNAIWVKVLQCRYKLPGYASNLAWVMERISKRSLKKMNLNITSISKLPPQGAESCHLEGFDKVLHRQTPLRQRPNLRLGFEVKPEQPSQKYQAYE